MSPAQRTIHQSLETRDSYDQAAREGAALRGELGIEAQMVAMSALYQELRAAGRIDEAQALRAEAFRLKAGQS